MKKVKLKDYKGDCVAILDAESVDGIYLVGAYEVEELEAFKNAGYTIYGTLVQKIFDEDFIQEIQNKFEDHADEYGYSDTNDYIDYDSKEFKKVKNTIKEFIDSIEDINKYYYRDKETIIELE